MPSAWPRTPEQKAKRDARVKKWVESNREKMRENYKRWYWKHAEKEREASRVRYANRSERVAKLERNSHYKSRYGITLNDYEAMLALQNGLCAVCESDKGGKLGQWFAVDHCHATGKVRGLLCLRCNVAVGFYEKHHARIAKYLQDA